MGAILVAVWVPAQQRRNLRRDAKEQNAREAREHLLRLTVALRAEINAALEAGHRLEFAIGRTLKATEEAEASGATVVGKGAITPGSMVATDAIVYRQVAAELGQLPPELIRSVVIFYSLALDLGRLADGASTARQAYESVLPLLPRLRMNAATLIATLDKFETLGFAANADLRLTPQELRGLATKVGYPLEEILRERGFSPD